MINIELIQGKRQRKCNRCSNKIDNYYIYKSKSICKECIEYYLDLKVTCSICNKKINRRYEYIPIEEANTTKVFCSKECYDYFIKEKKDLEELNLFLKEYHKIDTLNPRIYVQINEFKKKYNFTIKGMLLTLKYIINTLKKEIPIDNISLVQYYYDKAKEEYITKASREKVAIKLQESNYNMVSGVKKIKIKYNINRKNILITNLNLGEENE